MKRLKKFLVRIALVFVILLAAVFLLRNVIACKAVEIGTQQMTGFPLEIASVDLGMFGGAMEVRGLKLMNPPDFPEKMFVDLPLFKVDYRTLSMLRGAPHIRELIVNVNEVILVKNEKGESNVDRIQAKISPPPSSDKSSPATAPSKPEKKTTYRVDVVRVRIGTVIRKDYSKGKPTEQKFVLNQEVVFKDITESTSISALILRTMLGPIGNVAGDLVKGAGETLKGAGDTLQKTGKGLFENLKKAVPGK